MQVPRTAKKTEREKKGGGGRVCLEWHIEITATTSRLGRTTDLVLAVAVYWTTIQEISDIIIYKVLDFLIEILPLALGGGHYSRSTLFHT
jgi:hypothetical protein